MALTTSPFASGIPYALTSQTVLNNTGNENIRGGPCTLYSVMINNTTVGSSANWAKFYDSTGQGLTLGTTGPEFIFPMEATAILDIHIPTGYALTNGLTVACSKEAGNTLTAAPDQGVVAHFGST